MPSTKLQSIYTNRLTGENVNMLQGVTFQKECEITGIVPRYPLGSKTVE